MSFDRAAALVPLTVLDAIGSTNDALPDDAAPWTSVATLDQRAGRGRLGREWAAPAGKCLALSVLVRPEAPESRWGWVPLLAGVAARTAIAPLVSRPATLKWPNDVLIAERKTAGLLCERRGGGIVVGLGVNLTLEPHELPTTHATSLALEGARVEAGAVALADEVVAAFVTELRRLVALLADPAVDDAALIAIVAPGIGTIGKHVRVELPSGDILTGTATGLAAGGALVVSPWSGDPVTLAAGDVVHVR